MSNENQFTNSTAAPSVQETMENIWRTTCGSWENCNESTVQSFLSECQEHNLDPQFCMSWVEQHRDKIPNWSAVSHTTLEWSTNILPSARPFLGQS